MPGLTRPLRDMRHVKPGKHHNKREVSRGEALGSHPELRPHGGSSDQGRQRPDACADPELRRRCEHVRLPAARHGRRRGAEPLHAVGQHPLRDLHEDGHAGRRDAARQRFVGRQSERSDLRGTTTTATRSCSTTSTRAAGSRRSSRSRTSRTGPSTSASRSRAPTTRRGPGAATSTSVSANKLNDYPKFGVWPTQNAYMATINQFIAPNFSWGGVGIMAFERDQMIACGPARMLYRDMFAEAPGPLGRHASGGRRRPDAAACECARSDDRGRRPRTGIRRTSRWIASTSGTRPRTGAAVATLTMTHEGALPTAPFDGILCGFSPCVPQPGTSQKLDTLGDRFMYRHGLPELR